DSPQELLVRQPVGELRLIREPHEVAARAAGHTPHRLVGRLPGAELAVERGHESRELLFRRALSRLRASRPIDLAVRLVGGQCSEVLDAALGLLGPTARREKQPESNDPDAGSDTDLHAGALEWYAQRSGAGSRGARFPR